MAADGPTRSKLALRGSAKLVSEFFGTIPLSLLLTFRIQYQQVSLGCIWTNYDKCALPKGNISSRRFQSGQEVWTLCPDYYRRRSQKLHQENHGAIESYEPVRSHQRC